VTLEDFIPRFVLGVRILVAGAFVLSLVLAFTRSAIVDGKLNAFGWWARFVRRWSDPILKPLERRLARAGANPVDAPYWLVGVALVGGLVVISLVNWAIGFFVTLYDSAGSGTLPMIAVRTAFEILKLAIMVRVVVSWLSISPQSKFLRWVRFLTDWLVEPIHSIVPPIGMFDFSPLIAYVVLSFAQQLVMRGLFS
jgi:YggT family protein